MRARMRDKRAPQRRRLVEKAQNALLHAAGTRHRGRRFAALAVAIGVPAVAAPVDWDRFTPAEPQVELAQSAPKMPFETGGQSFPGSAFYYLEDAPRYAPEMDDTSLALFDMSGTGAAQPAALAASRNAGPAAKAFFSASTGISKARALQCLTSAVYYEAASEAQAGQQAVAQVVLNRVAHPSYPNSVCGVVFQGSERKTGCQFSFTCDGSMDRKPGAGAWARAQRVAQSALSGAVYAPVGLATHYHTVWVHPYWAPSLDHIGTIGAHRFYRWKGFAGKPDAFSARYSGAEPVAAPHARGTIAASSAASADAADPVALAKAYEDARLKALAKHKAAGRAKPPSPQYSRAIEDRGGEKLFEAENLPASGDVKPEYANSGRWINEPK